MVSNQEEVGVVVVSEGEDDVFAFGTVMSLSTILSAVSEHYSGPRNSELVQTPCVLLEIMQTLISNSSLGCLGPLRSILGQLNEDANSNVGLVLHGRYHNLPLELIGPLHKSLFEDLKWAQTNQNERQHLFARIKSCIFLAPVSSSSDTSTGADKILDVIGNTSIVFDHFEDEVYLQHATLAVQFTPFCSANSKQYVLMVVPLDAIQKKCLALISSMTS